jgi:hypothetical protein
MVNLDVLEEVSNAINDESPATKLLHSGMVAVMTLDVHL